MIRIIDNFLDETLLENVFSFISLNCNRNVWRTSLSWNQDIVLDSNIVQLLPLTENSIQKRLEDKYTEMSSLTGKYTDFSFHVYIWPKLTYIPFHTDGHTSFASTIYLNKKWSKDYGGLFLYEKNEELLAVEPRYNRCIINPNAILHGTSMTTFNAPPRITIQVFAK